jgi:hypothetical protein
VLLSNSLRRKRLRHARRARRDHAGRGIEARGALTHDTLDLRTDA